VGPAPVALAVAGQAGARRDTNLARGPRNNLLGSASRVLEVTAEQRELSRLSREEWREYTKTVWHIANVTDELHPAVFPSEIPQRLVKLFCFRDERVLDPFAGVGTTRIER
jgi:hypothetical protein